MDRKLPRWTHISFVWASSLVVGESLINNFYTLNKLEARTEYY
jgi:hypothetical protein